MKNWRYYFITYTTFDNKTRRFKGTLCSEDEKVIDKIMEFVETKQWPEEPFDYRARNMEWGLAPYQTMGVRRHGNQRQFPNETQYLYYLMILHYGVIHKIASECCNDIDFGKALLREATTRAIKKDEERVANLLASGYKKENINLKESQDALKRATNRIRYHQTTSGFGYGNLSEFRRIIEEFELFTVRKIKLSENGRKTGKKVS